MKLHPDKLDSVAITGYGPGWIGLNGEKVHHSLVISTQGQPVPWACGRFEDLTAAHFEQMAGLDAELVLFGSGLQLRFPRPEWLASLAARNIGVETMTTEAACRTFNILAAERRRVVAALLLETP